MLISNTLFLFLQNIRGGVFYLQLFPINFLVLPQLTRYIQLVKKHGLEISQPGLEPNNGLTWQMTKRRGDREVHK